MLSTRGIVRYFSTRPFIDKWFNALQLLEHDEQQKRLAECIEFIVQENKINYSKLIHNIIHRWSIEEPSKDALWTSKGDNNQDQKFTFKEIYMQSIDFSRILTGKQFNLTVGQNILVLLPPGTKERLLLQLACLQNNINFFSFDSQSLNAQTIFQQIRTSAIDCIITNDEYFDIIINCTFNAMRPLKKGLIIKQMRSQPLPVGWYPIMTGDSFIENKETLNQSTQTKVSFSQAKSSLDQLLTAYWLNTTKSPRLIWIKNNYDQISLAAWLLGSTIFFNETSNSQTIIEILKTYPIDTLCLSKNQHQLINKQTQHHIRVLCTENLQLRTSISAELSSNQSTCVKKKWIQ